MIHGRHRLCDPQHDRLEFDDVDAIDRRHRAEPSGRAAGAEADHAGRAWIRMKDRGEQTAHHLRRCIAARAAVRFTVHDEREVVAGVERDAALAAVGVPRERATLFIHPEMNIATRFRIGGTSRADAGVSPYGGWPERETTADGEERDDGCDAGDLELSRANGNDDRKRAERDQ